MKRIIYLMLCLILLVSVVPIALADTTDPAQEQPASVVASGTCGANLNWTLSDSGEFKITGSGPMDDYSTYGVQPWADYRDQIKSVSLSSSQTTVGNFAFDSCKNLSSVWFPSSLTRIGAFAFNYDTSLKSISITGNIKTVDAGAFSYCTKLETVTIENGVEVLGEQAFMFCQTLESLEMPDSVKTLGKTCFQGCKALKNVRISPNIKVLPWLAFDSCNALEYVKIPAGVEELDNPFQRAASLSRVDLPNTVKKISNHSFPSTQPVDVYFFGTQSEWDAVTIQNGNFPSNVTVHVAGYCGDDLIWSLDGTVLNIVGTGDMYDYDWNYGYSVPWADALETITEVNLPEGMTSIGNYAFPSMSALTSFVIPSTVTRIGEWSMTGLSGVQELVLPEGIQKIGDGAFSGSGFTSVVLPDGLADGEIGIRAFEACTELEHVTLPNGMDSIPDEMFAYCHKLNHVMIPDSVTEIGDNAFFECLALTDITLPYRLTSIGFGVFGGCTALEGIELPRSIKEIGQYAFYGCSALKTINLGNVVRIFPNAFENCSSLQEISLSPIVKTIDEKAFLNSGLTDVWFSGTQVEWNAVTVADDAIPFDTEIHFVQKCGDDLYWKVEGKKLIITGSGPMYDYAEMYMWDETKIPWYGSRASITSVTLPNGITYLSTYSFNGFTSLVSISIPDSVKEIGYNLFAGCTKLSSVRLPKNIRVLADDDFRGCTSLQSIDLSASVTSIGDGCFYGCKALKTIDLRRVTWIGATAFEGCTSLGEVILTGDIIGVGGDAFKNCTALSRFVGPNSFNESYGCPFYGCTKLTSVTMRGEIPYQFFKDLTTLQTLTLTKSVDRISEEAFAGCTGLTDVYYVGTPMDKYDILEYPHAIKEGNDPLYSATWHYLTSETCRFAEGEVEYRGTTPYVICDKTPKTPFVQVEMEGAFPIDPELYTVTYSCNTQPGTGYASIAIDGAPFTIDLWFKIYMPATTTTTVANTDDGIQVSWTAVDGAAGYVIYRRAWSSTTDGWTTFERWNNTTATTWTDTKVYAGTRYQYGIKAYFTRRTDPVSGALIGGAMDNFNLGVVGPLKTTVRITTRVLKSVTPGTKQLTVKWAGSSVFTGYQVQIATDTGFTKNVKTEKIANMKTYQTTIKNLKANTTYYVRVRSYHVFNGMTYYGGWSNVLSAKTK
jgi:hypothetical protein